MTLRFSLLLAVVATAAGLVPVSVASAATVEVGQSETVLGGSPVIFRAGSGEVNRLTVSSVRGDVDSVTFRDTGAAISTGKGCAGAASGSVTCRVNNIAGVRVRLGNRADHLDASALRDPKRSSPAPGNSFFAVELYGGSGADKMLGANAEYTCIYGKGGNDRIATAISRPVPRSSVCYSSGGRGNDRLIGDESHNVFAGGAGKDRLIGRGGRDKFNGGNGEDVIRGGTGLDIMNASKGSDVMAGGPGDDRFIIDYRKANGNDLLRGGPGSDLARFICPSCRVSLDGRANDGERGNQSRNSLFQVEDLMTTSSRFDNESEELVDFGPGNDLLIGNRFPNLLIGNRGPDRIIGGRGEDDLRGGPGDDWINAADGEPDIVRCGTGQDEAVIDPDVDSLRGCETVNGNAA